MYLSSLVLSGPHVQLSKILMLLERDGTLRETMDELQFEKADYSGQPHTPCSSCGASLTGEYWQANGHPVCAPCATQLRTLTTAPTRQQMLQGALYALGAGVVAAIGYAIIVVVTGYDLALLSIGVGWLIGKAALRGAGEKGSRPLQYIALAAAYLAICGTFYAQILYGLAKQGRAINGIANYLMLYVLSLGKPYFELKEGLGGLIGLAILFFGLQQAWQQTRGATLEITGPHAMAAVQQ